MRLWYGTMVGSCINPWTTAHPRCCCIPQYACPLRSWYDWPSSNNTTLRSSKGGIHYSSSMLLCSLVCMSIAFMMDEGVSTWSFGFRDRCALYISHSRCSYLICVAVNFDSLGGYFGTVAAKQCLILLLSRRFPLYGIVKLFLDGIEIICFFITPATTMCYWFQWY